MMPSSFVSPPSAASATTFDVGAPSLPNRFAAMIVAAGLTGPLDGMRTAPGPSSCQPHQAATQASAAPATSVASAARTLIAIIDSPSGSRLPHESAAAAPAALPVRAAAHAVRGHRAESGEVRDQRFDR